MKKRFKMAFKPLFQVWADNLAGGGGKIENRHGFAVLAAGIDVVQNSKMA
jgi:hypothetical protein